MAIDAEQLLARRFDDIEQTYTERDSILYALGFGFGSGPAEERELRYVYEDGLVACPTMAVVLGYPAMWIRDPALGADWRRAVHGEQWLTLHRPLAPRGAVVGRTRVTDVVDKGADKGAVVHCRRDLIDKASGDALASLAMSIVLRGDGGFGGSSGPAQAPAPHMLPERPPDAACALPTWGGQALLYRLSGDPNPLHADPETARAAGFPRPILHGLSTYGVAARAVLRTYCDYEPERLRRLDVRFSAPVFPGETIRVEMWRDGSLVSFRALVPERGAVVLNNGRAELA